MKGERVNLSPRLEEIMKVVDYITEKEDNEFCRHCNEICSRHCVIWRKASMRYDEAEKEERDENRH